MADLVFGGVAGSGTDLVLGGDAAAGDAPAAEVRGPGDLWFYRPPGGLGASDLLFGDDDGVAPDQPAAVDLAVEGLLPELEAVLHIALVERLCIAGLLSELEAEVSAVYDTRTQRPTVGSTHVRWQDGGPASAAAGAGWSDAPAVRAGFFARGQDAARLASDVAMHVADAARREQGLRGRWQDAVRLAAGPYGISIADGVRGGYHQLFSLWQSGTRLHRGARIDSDDGLRMGSTAFRSGWQVAARLALGHESALGGGLACDADWRSRWQQAMVPPAGMWLRPVPPPGGDPCYAPPAGGAVQLVFGDVWDGSGAMVFVCERHGGGPEEPVPTVVIPIRSVYVIYNDITIQRIGGSSELRARTFSMMLDADSWTWSCSATFDEAALAGLEPALDGAPVEIEATVNGVAYRFAVISLGRDRTFGSARLSMTARGRGALLDVPYSPVRNFGNAEQRTAQQLMAEVLTVNGAPLGWDLDWHLDDWMVPGGAWSHQGSYISAVNAIAAAVGGYVQPHATAQTLRVLPRYPAAPWAWSGVTPDYQLPIDVTVREGIEWQELPRYDRVYVSGIAKGVLGQFTRAGTAGNLVAPMVTDALITDVTAARQRSLSILANTGRQARVSLSLPVLPETGLITPGKFVRYVDGGTTRLGIVRSTAVSWARPKLRQTIGVETHV